MSHEEETQNFLPDEDEDYEDPELRDCLICGGDGYVESDDPLWDDDDFVVCYSCHGSGRRKDMTIW